MNLIMFDDGRRVSLLPLTFTRPAADMRVGILTIRQKWEKALQATSSTLTETYLQAQYPLQVGDDNLWVAGTLLPNDALIVAIENLQVGEALYADHDLLAFRTDSRIDAEQLYASHLRTHTTLPLAIKSYQGDYQSITRPYHLFQYNAQEIEFDFHLLTKGRTSQPLSDSNCVIGSPERIFVEEGATVEGATLNTKEGSIYIGAGAEVMEGSRLRGPVALCDHSVTKMNAQIYGGTTIGPHSKVGGEVSNIVIFGYSNKAHDGFIGNSVIGEWCNLGASTTSSNLKNNYSSVRLWNYATGSMEDTQLQFCGLIMGDYTKCGINTMFNTGTVVGVNCCLYGGGLHPKHIPSFSFGTPEGYAPYELEKAFETATIVYQRRHKSWGTIEQNILKKVYEDTILKS